MGLLGKLFGKKEAYCLYLKVASFDLLPLVTVTIDGTQVWPFSTLPDTSDSNPETAFFKLSDLAPEQDVKIGIDGQVWGLVMPPGKGHMLFIEVAADHSLKSFFMEEHIADLEKQKDRDKWPSASAQIMVPQDEKSPITVGMVSYDHEVARAELNELLASFEVQPGVKLHDVLERQREAQVIKWLNPDSNEAEPKALVRLLLEMSRQGLNLWEQPGIVMFLEGRWSRGGPSAETGKALKSLCAIFQVPIRLFYSDKQEGGNYTRLDWTYDKDGK